MNYKKYLLFTFGLSLVFFFQTKTSSADIDLSSGIWETSYDCADWYQTTAGESYCGVTWGSSYCASFGAGAMALPCDQDTDSRSATISSSVNNPAGVSGSGAHIHYFGTLADGVPSVNNKSSGSTIEFEPVNEIWWRWYVYYEDDSNITGWKNFRIKDNADNELWSAIPYSQTLKYVQIYFVAAGHAVYSPDNAPAGNWMEQNNRQGYGTWLAHEVHIKIDTDGTDGVYQFWLNDMLVIDRYNLDIGLNNIATIESANNGSGIASISGQRLVGIYHDDYALATTAYSGFVDDGNGNDRIGLLSRDTTAPNSPSGLSVL